MADTPTIFGKKMRQAHENRLMWCANHVWLHKRERTWFWEIDLEHTEVCSGHATRRHDACRQIEAAIERIRNAAKHLGT